MTGKPRGWTDLASPSAFRSRSDRDHQDRSGFSERADPAALVIGPTDVALSKNHKMLYVADSLNNRNMRLLGLKRVNGIDRGSAGSR